MTEIESIEHHVPIGMQLEIDQLQRDYLVARAKRARSEYIATLVRKLGRTFREVITGARGDASLGRTAEPLRQLPQ